MKATDIFQFDKNIPPELLPRIKALVTPLHILVPKWCQIVGVKYCGAPVTNGEAESLYAQASVSYQYRECGIKFFPFFFEQSPESQKEICIHEFIHFTLNIPYEYAGRELKVLLAGDESANYRTSVMEELEERLESATQDMCWIIRGLME